MYLNPPSSCYQRALQSHVFTNCPDLAISSKLYPPVNNFFQCFPYAPKLLSTLRMGEVSVWAKNHSRMCRWRGRSEGNFREMVQTIVGKQSLTLKCLARVFSLKIFLEKLLVLLTISWVKRVYIVLVKVYEKAHLKTSGREFCRSLATWLELQTTRKIQPSKDSSNSNMCFLCGIFVGWHS